MGGPHSGASAHTGGQHETSARPGALWAQAGLWGRLTLSFPPLSEHSDHVPCTQGHGGQSGNPSCSPWGSGQAGRRRDTGAGPFPRHLWRTERPGGVGRERRPVRRTQEGARESVTQGIVCRVSAKLAEQTPEPGVRGQGDMAGGPCGPPLPFLEKACFPGQNPTPDPPPQGRMFRAAWWSWRPAPPLSPSPGPAILVESLVLGALCPQEQSPPLPAGAVWFSAALGLQISSGLAGGSWNLTSQCCLRGPGTIWFM